MEKFALDSLSIDATEAGAPPLLTLRFCGKSRDRQPGKVLGPYLTAAIDRAKSLGAHLAMRFEDLEYMNSGTVMAIVQTIHRAKKAGVPLALTYNDTVEWQRLSFDPMKVLAAPGAVEIAAAQPATAKAVPA